MGVWAYFAIAAAASVLLAAILAFNHMVRLRNRVRRAWKDIDVQLKLRHELVPRLVSTAAGYAAHEKEVLERAARLRAEALAAESARERGAREAGLASALREVLALKESYPELKADEAFESLFQKTVKVEDHLAAARKYYNGSVRAYNTFIQSFPQALLARLFRFRPAEYFQDEKGPETAPSA